MALSIRTKSAFLVGTKRGSASKAQAETQIATTSTHLGPTRSSSWQPGPWTPSQWDPNDTAVRRFSDPADHGEQKKLAQHIAGARTAYAKAYLAIQKSSAALAKSTKNLDVSALLGASTEKDVAEAALGLYAESTVEKDAVSKFVDTLHHYHGVFDVLCQVDLGYLTVIWGGMKLVLIMAKNRGDLVVKLTDALVDIGLALSRVEMVVKLYPTTRMVELTSRLYSAVLEFLEEVILLFQRSAVRQMFSSLVRPFDEKFGRVIDRIQRVGNWIRDDVMVLHAMQTHSIAQHQFDSFLQRQQMEATLNNIPRGHVPDIFLKIKDTLFQGFEHQASYHESLAATYGVTAGAWNEWFGIEQKYLPSSAAPTTRLTQGLCDAPDFQHALQWSAQQKAKSPQIPSAYIIWTPDMTAHSAIASLIFQIIQQRPTVVSERNFDMNMFSRANASITALWAMFVNLMKVLGGCLIYISIGSVGPDEFAVVEKFVKTVQTWDGPPINVTIIHPPNKSFITDPNVTDIDGLYDVHPSLTTTDALQHVLMLELDIHEVPQTIRTLLWDAVWRETRYAIIGVSLNRLTEQIQALSLELLTSSQPEIPETARDMWLAGLTRWAANVVAVNNIREQIQRHLEIVDLNIPGEVRQSLGRHVKLLVFRVDTARVGELGSKSLTQEQRDRIWGAMDEALSAGPKAMFCGGVRERLEYALEEFSAVPSRNAKQAELAVMRLLDEQFGWDGEWKTTVSMDEGLIVESIREGLATGFELVIEALLEEGG
ncbi:hypothetical protein OQA88_586 [Cercophora sp. LCS_1]